MTDTKAATVAAPRPLWLIGAIGVLAGIILTLAVQQAGMAWKAYQAKPETFLASNKAKDKDVKETPSGLQYKVVKPGTGPNPTDADITLITYEGKLTDGTTFDKSQQPTPMPVAGVVPGFSEALKLMQRGGSSPALVMATRQRARSRPIRCWCSMSRCSISNPKPKFARCSRVVQRQRVAQCPGRARCRASRRERLHPNAVSRVI